MLYESRYQNINKLRYMYACVLYFVLKCLFYLYFMQQTAEQGVFVTKTGFNSNGFYENINAVSPVEYIQGKFRIVSAITEYFCCMTGNNDEA